MLVSFVTNLSGSELGPGGGRASFIIEIENTSDHADQYDFFAEDNTWGVTFSDLVTPILNPGEVFTLQAFVSIPLGIDPMATDTALISARSLKDGGTRAYDFINTAVVPEASTFLSVGMASFGALALGVWRRQSGS
jgi:hypothetical protein